MKASIEWLEEYSNIDKTAQELGDILTLTGSKVEGVESKGGDIKNVVVGKILEVTKHPDADKLVITKVDVVIRQTRRIEKIFIPPSNVSAR